MVIIGLHHPCRFAVRLPGEWGEYGHTEALGASGLPTTFRYTRQRQDSYINMYWYGSRWYDPSLYRWTSLIPLYPKQRKVYKHGTDLPIPTTIPSPTKTRQDIASMEMGIIIIRRLRQHQLIAIQAVMHVKLPMVMLQIVVVLMILQIKYKL
jgi:RHS repeat-associated protein